MVNINTVVWDDRTERWHVFKGIKSEDELFEIFPHGFTSYGIDTDENGIIIYDEYLQDNIGKSFSVLYNYN